MPPCIQWFIYQNVIQAKKANARNMHFLSKIHRLVKGKFSIDLDNLYTKLWAHPCSIFLIPRQSLKTYLYKKSMMWKKI